MRIATFLLIVIGSAIGAALWLEPRNLTRTYHKLAEEQHPHGMVAMTEEDRPTQ